MKHKRPILVVLCLSVVMFLSACSSNIPPDIRQPVDGAPEFAEVRAHAEGYLSNRFRWGGVILGTENKLDSSWINIIAFPLSDNGRPQITEQSPGRFFAVASGFLEPLVYNQKREITVIGKLVKTKVSKVGEYDYEYPVIEIEEFFLWPPRPKVVDMERYYYGPYYRPYGPYYGWPYFPHPYYYH